MLDLTVHTDVLSVVSCLSSVELDCDVALDDFTVVTVAGLAIDTAGSVVCVAFAFICWPCVKYVAATTLFINDLLCKEQEKAHNSKLPL